MQRVQPFVFGMSDSLIAEVGGVPLDALHRDVDAICRCCDRIPEVAARLGVKPPQPRLAGFSYCHVSALGAPVVFAAGSEPNVVPIIRTPEDIDELRAPADYLTSGVVPERLRALDALLARRPEARRSIGHTYEGPMTTAALLMGQDFFLLPYEDPTRAHRLLSFCTESALEYCRAISERLGHPLSPGPVGIPDDFAGILPPAPFQEFVMPYWERFYTALEATDRRLHSELLREEHLPFLADLNIAEYDPSADQYLTAELLRARCPVPFTARIQSWHIRDLAPAQLQSMYRRLAACEPTRISFYMNRLADEEKILAILEAARELAS